RARHLPRTDLDRENGTQAQRRASVIATVATPCGYKTFAQGRYVDRVVKQAGQWRIAQRRVDIDGLAAGPQKVVSLADPEVAALIQPLFDAAVRLSEKVEG